MTKIINLFGYQLHEDPPEQFLEKVKSVQFDTVLVIGEEVDGTLFLGGNTGDMKQNSWLLQRAIRKMQDLERSLEQ